MSNHEFIVEELKIRVDKFLVKQLPQISRSQIQKDIEGGQAEVNGQPVTANKFVVRQNDKVIYKESGIRNQESGIKPTNTPLKILYNNHGLLIIDKPAGLAVHPGAGFKGETLASALLYQFSPYGGSPEGGKNIHLVGEEHRPGIVHRLDKDTSGVILVAATQEMYLYLKDAFLDRRIKKEYLALVLGRIEKNHGIINTPIGRSKIDFRKYATKNMVEPKEALTEYKVLEYLGSEVSENRKIGKSDFSDQSDSSDFSGTINWGKEKINSKHKSDLDQYTLLLVKLHTGRTHQIRAHFSSIGHPLMGDELYGNKKNQIEGLNRQFLHAKKIEVQLPDGTWIEAESELPDELKGVLKQLGSKVVNML